MTLFMILGSLHHITSDTSLLHLEGDHVPVNYLSVQTLLAPKLTSQALSMHRLCVGMVLGLLKRFNV